MGMTYSYVAGFASFASILPLLPTTLRCGLEECRQLRWLVVSKNHAVRALASAHPLQKMRRMSIALRIQPDQLTQRIYPQMEDLKFVTL
jgi:hypothetical protein